MVTRNRGDIEGLRRANQAAAWLVRELAALAQPGVTTRALNDHALAAMTRLGATPVFQTEAGFPACICTSLNEVVLHGIPNDQPLRVGDLLSIDAGMLLDGYCGDTTVTVAIGPVTPERQRLIETTHGAMLAGIAAASAGQRIGDIGHAIQRYAEARGFGVMRDFTGHGLGRRMHEEPMVPFVGRPGTGPLMPAGLVITVEPILVERSPDWVLDADGWTVRTQDGGWAAQFEHTILVTKRGAVVLSAA